MLKNKYPKHDYKYRFVQSLVDDAVFFCLEQKQEEKFMPKSKKEGIMFSFLMSAIMIFFMAELNYGVRTGDFGAESWGHAVTAFIPGYLFGMICDLFICTPLSRKLTFRIAGDSKEGVQVFSIRFCMVVLMTVFMTVFGVFAGGGKGTEVIMGSIMYFPYNFTIALPIQMLIVAPFSAKVVGRICENR